MGKTKSEMKKEAKKKARRNQYEAQRNASHAVPQKRPIDPKTFTSKLMPDYLQLVNGVEQLKKIAKERIKIITDLKTKDPDKYKHIDLQAYQTYDEGLKNMDDVLRRVAQFIGEVEDVPSYAEKMIIIHDNISLMSEAMTMFQMQMMALQGLDEAFKASLPSAPQPENLDVPNEEVKDATATDCQEDSTIEQQSVETSNESIEEPIQEEVEVDTLVQEAESEPTKISHPIKIQGLD